MTGPDCPSGKVGYPTRTLAQSMLVKRLGSRRDPPPHLSIYQCKLCGRYHLTSRTPVKFKGDKRVPNE